MLPKNSVTNTTTFLQPDEQPSNQSSSSSSSSTVLCYSSDSHISSSANNEVKVTKEVVSTKLPKIAQDTDETYIYDWRKLKALTSQLEINPELLSWRKYLYKLNNPKRAEDNLLLAAHNYSSLATHYIGDCYFEKQLYTTAVKFYQKSATQNNVKACCSLGTCYFFGLGIEQSYEKAYQWYLKAAIMRHPLAQYALYLCYKNGHGITRDFTIATKWLTAAVANGFDPITAQTQLGMCYYWGRVVTLNFTKALELLQQAYLNESTQKFYLLRNILQCYSGLIQITEDPEKKQSLTIECYAWRRTKFLLLIERQHKKFAKIYTPQKESHSIVTLQDIKNYLDLYPKSSATSRQALLAFNLTAFYKFITLTAQPQNTKIVLDDAHLLQFYNILDEGKCLIDNDQLSHATLVLQARVCDAYSTPYICRAEDAVVIEHNTNKHSAAACYEYENYIQNIDTLVGVNIAKFLSVKELFCLAATNRWWHKTIATHDYRYAIYHELFIVPKSSTYNSRTFYLTQTLLEFGLIMLIWYVHGNDNFWLTRLLAGFLIGMLIVLSKKNHMLRQKYSRLELFQVKPLHTLAAIIHNDKSLLVTIRHNIQTAITTFNKSTEKFIDSLIQFKATANSQVTIKDVLETFHAECTELQKTLLATKKLLSELDTSLNSLTECIPQKKIPGLPYEIDYDLNLLLNRNLNPAALYECIDDILLYFKPRFTELTETYHAITHSSANTYLAQSFFSSSSATVTTFPALSSTDQLNAIIEHWLDFSKIVATKLGGSKILSAELQLDAKSQGKIYS